MTLYGIDISNNNGTIDWNQVKADGVAFAMIKACEGVAFADSDLPYNWANAKRVGMVRGAYAFARPEYGNTPEAEADMFLRQIGQSLEPGDLLALDMEPLNGVNYSAWTLAWLRRVEAAVGFAPFVYTFPSFAATLLTDPALARYPLWLAALDSLPARIGVWPRVTLWQNNWHARYNGLATEVDQDTYYPSIDALRALGKPGLPAPPAPAAAHPRYRVLFDGALHTRPAMDAPLTRHIKAGDILVAVTTDSTPWISLNLPDGTWGGWDLHSNLQQL